MIDRIRELQQLSCLLEPDASGRREAAQAVIEYTEHFLQGLTQAPAYHLAEDGAALFENPISAKGMDLEKLLELLEDNVDNQGVNTPSPRHLAFIPGGALLALGEESERCTVNSGWGRGRD